MAKIGIMDIFKKESEEAPVTPTTPTPEAPASEATEVAQDEGSKHSGCARPAGGSAEAVGASPVTTGAGDRYSQTGNACTPDGEEPASEEEAVANGEAQTNEAQESKVEKATGKAEATPDKKGGWVDWEIGLNSRYLIADVSGEDGFFGSPAELLPFAFRIFEAILKDGKNEDKKAAHGALKFLTENYQSFPAPQPAAPVAKRDVIIPESLKEVAQAKSDPAPATAKSSTKARLPIPALGYFDLDGRVRSYKEWKDAGNPDDWDEEVVWKFDDVWSNITVPRDIAQGFYDGKSYDLQVDHDFARKAQAALQEWLSKKRRR